MKHAPDAYRGFFFDQPLADWACILVVALAVFALVLLIPAPAPGAAWVALVMPTRRSLRTRLGARLRAAYLRWRIWHAERDLEQHKAELVNAMAHWPAQIDVDRAFIDRLTRQLTRTTHDF